MPRGTSGTAAFVIGGSWPCSRGPASRGALRVAARSAPRSARCVTAFGSGPRFRRLGPGLGLWCHRLSHAIAHCHELGFALGVRINEIAEERARPFVAEGDWV